MIRLTTSAGVFGPYEVVETLDDRYRCDGADLPFAVVGQGVIDEWEGPMPVPPIPPEPVPDMITPRQCRLQLLAMGLLDDVEAAIDTMGAAAKIEWEYALELKRTYSLVAAMQQLFQWSDAEMDTFFVEAAKL